VCCPFVFASRVVIVGSFVHLRRKSTTATIPAGASRRIPSAGPNRFRFNGFFSAVGLRRRAPCVTQF
jgi:hypothetical protein